AEARSAQELVQVMGGNPDPGRAPLNYPACRFAANGRKLALEFAHPSLAGMGGNNSAQDTVGYFQETGLQPVGGHLLGQQVPAPDLHLLLLGVAPDLDYLHAVAQRARYAIESVGRGDE